MEPGYKEHFFFNLRKFSQKCEILGKNAFKSQLKGFT